MKAILKIVTDSSGINLENLRRLGDKNFSILLYMNIGPKDIEGGHDYWLTVCTPEWLKVNSTYEKVVCGRHKIIVNEYNADIIVGAIEKIINSCDNGDFESTSAKLGRFFLWEFEDYKI